MRTLNLNEYGVAELNASEMRQTDGGFWLLELFLFFNAHTAEAPAPDPIILPEYNIQWNNVLDALDGINNWGESGTTTQ